MNHRSRQMKNVIIYHQPLDSPPPTRMKRVNWQGQWRVGYDVLRLGLAFPRLLLAPRGKQTPVILIPGWFAPESSMSPLKFFLRVNGYDARHWGLGTNVGEPERQCEELIAQLTRQVQQTNRPVTLIGWSLGGVIAREAARRIPHAITQVITYGTPTVGGPTYTLGASRVGKQECERITRMLEELDATSPITVPITAVFSRRDEVVSWPACIDRVSPRVKHFEVGSTHISMGLDPDVWRLVAEQLSVHNLS